jgi:hypothetical protein
VPEVELEKDVDESHSPLRDARGERSGVQAPTERPLTNGTGFLISRVSYSQLWQTKGTGVPLAWPAAAIFPGEVSTNVSSVPGWSTTFL